MSYPAGHRAAVKKNIIDSARKLFNRRGFESVSLNQIMAGAGLTHGGFYSYFKCKCDLHAALLGCFFTDPEWKAAWEGVHVDLSSTDGGPQVVRACCISRTPRTPAHGSVADRRRAQRRKCEARLRDCVQS